MHTNKTESTPHACEIAVNGTPANARIITAISGGYTNGVGSAAVPASRDVWRKTESAVRL